MSAPHAHDGHAKRVIRRRPGGRPRKIDRTDFSHVFDLMCAGLYHDQGWTAPQIKEHLLPDFDGLSIINIRNAAHRGLAHRERASENEAAPAAEITARGLDSHLESATAINADIVPAPGSSQPQERTNATETTN